MAREHSAILSMIIKLPFVLNPWENFKNSSRKVIILFKNKVQELDMICS